LLSSVVIEDEDELLVDGYSEGDTIFY
jgi:hypothetical protein